MRTVPRVGICGLLSVAWLFASGIGTACRAAAEAVDTGLWTASLEIRASGYRGASALADFPVLVTFDPATVAGFSYAGFAPQGADLRFTDADNTVPLSHEIEAWNTNGVSRVWVRVPSLVTNRVIKAFWNNPGAGAPGSDQVWDAGFRGVWHLSDTLSDATANANTGVNTGTVATDGAVAGGRAFDGTAFIDCGNGASLNLSGDQLTLSAWIKPAAISGNAVISKAYDAAHSPPYYSWVLYTVSSSLHCRIDAAAATYGTLSLGQWQHVAAVYNGSQVTLFVNGQPAGSFSKTGAIWLTSRNVRIGGRDTGSLGEYFNGSIDEVRISAVARSADWIRAERDTVADAAFCTYGSVVVTPRVPRLSVADAQCLEGDSGRRFRVCGGIFH